MMMRWVLALLALMSMPAMAQTYLGVPDGNGSFASLFELDASNAHVPTDGTCDACEVITLDLYIATQNAARTADTWVSWPNFRHRFTASQLQGAFVARVNDPAGAFSALVALGEADGGVTLTSPQARDGMAALVMAGIVTAEQAANILDPNFPGN